MGIRSLIRFRKAFAYFSQRSQRHPRKFVKHSETNLSGISSQKGKFAFFRLRFQIATSQNLSHFWNDALSVEKIRHRAFVSSNPLIIAFFLISLLFLFSACQPDKNQQHAEQQIQLADSTSGVNLSSRIAALSRELKRSPDNWAVLKDRSLLYFQNGQLDSATRDVRRALDIYEDSPELHYLRGYYGLVNGDTSLASYQFELALNYGSGNPDTYYQMGQIAFFQHDFPLLKNITRKQRL